MVALKGDIAESVHVYEWLQAQYNAGKVNAHPLFQAKYCKFYRIRFLTPEWKNEYFALLKRGETDLKTILMTLRKHENVMGSRPGSSVSRPNCSTRRIHTYLSMTLGSKSN